jgi:hypothetical protein
MLILLLLLSQVKTVSGEMVIYMGPSWREWLGLAPRGKLHEVIDPSRTIKVMVPDEGKAVFVLDAAALQKVRGAEGGGPISVTAAPTCRRNTLDLLQIIAYSMSSNLDGCC